ncbi:MAG: methionyl-tRNA formyltransferase [Candidatus Omnitrophica bacterium]|nr:methionyl-tRNA formyltransferase [Candidatus Omnitrophota bacterium]
MKIIFFGSDDFASAHLDRMIQHKMNVVACVTQPDRPKGRGMKVLFSPVKESAIKNSIPVLQPDDLKSSNFIQELKKFDADLFVVIAYGRFLPSSVLKIPKIMAINVHGSLLPQYRGAAPINWAIINGESTTGLTIIKLNPRMDAGEIISAEKVIIQLEDNSMTLRQKMISKGCELLIRTIELIKTKQYKLIPQDEKLATFAPKLSRELGMIEWKKQSAEEIHNLVRGLLPWPAAQSSINGIAIKILKTEVVSQSKSGKPGEILEIDKRGMTVSTGNGALLIKEVHPPSSKQMTTDEFTRGHPVKVGDIFGK